MTAYVYNVISSSYSCVRVLQAALASASSTIPSRQYNRSPRRVACNRSVRESICDV